MRLGSWNKRGFPGSQTCLIFFVMAVALGSNEIYFKGSLRHLSAGK